jgi:hypothetical protein
LLLKTLSSECLADLLESTDVLARVPARKVGQSQNLMTADRDRDRAAYEQALERLLRDLRAEGAAPGAVDR